MIYLIIYIVSTLLAQVLLKREALKEKDNTKSYLLKMVKSPMVILAYSINLVNIFVWILALTEVSLLVAFFSTSCIYVIIIFVDKLMFNESLNLFKILGAISISIGIILNII